MQGRRRGLYLSVFTPHKVEHDQWNEIDSQVQEVERLMGLEIHQDG